jgi:multiple sugar transport system substrate-binding protein
MTSPEAMKANVQNGFPVAPRFSVSADPEAAATSPIVSVVERLAKRNLLKGWPRPPVPEYLSLEAILGEEIHRALRGEVSDRAALGSAQAEADRVMLVRAPGRSGMFISAIFLRAQSPAPL